LKKIENDLLPTLFANPTQKILTCITPLWNMCPPPIYPQLPDLHNHGLAMLAYITSLRNMRPPPVYGSHLKRSFEKVIFSSNIIKTPKSSSYGEKKEE
jgi:hypothetical protein